MFVLQSVPQVDPFMAKLAVFGLAVLSTITGNLAYRRVKKAYENNKEVPRQRFHIVVNFLTVLASAYLIVLGVSDTSHAGWITLMFATTAFISGMFTYRSMLVQMDRGDEKLDRPDMHAISGTVLVLYTAYMSLWDPISRATGIGDAVFAVVDILPHLF